MPNAEQIENLKKLAEVLDDVDENRFDMFWYTSEGDSPAFNFSDNTIACAVGWGAVAGIGDPKNFNDWAEYLYVGFGIACPGIQRDYLFGSLWERYDNTAKGAAARIRRYLRNYCRVEQNWIPWKN